MAIQHRIHPLTTLGVLCYAAGLFAAFLRPDAASVLVLIAYLCTLPEFLKYTSRFQFVMLLLSGTTLGVLLDLAGMGFPLMTIMMGLTITATIIRQALMPVWTNVRFTWVEPVLMTVAIALYAITVFRGGANWQSIALPGVPMLFATGLALFYFHDGHLLRRKASGGYRVVKGHQAPDFDLPDQSGVPVRLSSYIGCHPVLLVFIRGDWCPGCHIMLRTYEQNRERFLAKGIHVLGIGPDNVDVNRDMVERIGVGYKLLSDTNQRTASRYGVVYSNPLLEAGVNYEEGIPLPAAFLVDIHGVVRYVSRPDRVGEFLDPSLIFGVLETLPPVEPENRTWKAA